LEYAGGKAMVQDALKVIRNALAKNGPHVTDQVMAKDAKVSKRLQKQVEVVIASGEETQPRARLLPQHVQAPDLSNPRDWISPQSETAGYNMKWPRL
jgi:hypothetical protein